MALEGPPKIISSQSPAQTYAIIFLTLAVFFIIITAGFSALKKSQLAKQQREQNALNEKLNAAPISQTKKDVETFSAVLLKFKEINDKKIIWSDFLDELSKTQVKDARYSTVSMEENGGLKIEGAVKSLSSLSKLLTVLPQSKMFSNLNLTTIQLKDGEVDFSLQAQINKEVLKK
ncbi:PilN domain-containing protein [Candidatus Berkelbacteria bacterium]|nr:PilN domain-containing protein [Candidatus Berkelbacteria bacterium]MBI2588400.1 PilN domain-containing protein [Candidatus Berkelbacteria bacterium]